MKLILLGAPGAGKGTQAEILSKLLNIPTISTGNILRSAIHDGTSVGLAAKSYIDKGQLVPDNVIIDIVQERLSQSDCANGFILDGMPRTIPQAEALIAHGIVLDIVLSLEVSDEDIVERMAGRRVCPRCGASYHVRMNPPKQDGVCDACGGKLVIRKDDQPATVLDRLKAYHEQTEPLVAFYKERGKLTVVDNQPTLAENTKAVLAAIGVEA